MSRTLGALLLVAVLAFAGCVSPEETPAATASPPEAVAGALISDVQALAHRAGDNLSGLPVTGIVPAILDIGHEAGEPTIGVTKDGSLFYAAATFANDVLGQPVPLPRTDILRSDDGGRTWRDVTPYLPGNLVRAHPETGDPYVYVDVDTGRVFDIDQRLAVGCHTVVYTDNKGSSWSPGDGKACQTPPADHQTLVTAKPRVTPVSPLYPKIVYYCNNQIAASTCARSLDGGLTFAPIAPAYRGVEPEGGLCGGLHGHLSPAPDGTVYLPKTHCDVPMVSVTEDDGMTWTVHKVSDLPSTDDPSVAVDPKGTVHMVWINPKDWHVYLASSKDKGRTWTPALDVTAPGVTATNLPTLAAGGDGRLALAYVGTTHPDGYKVDRQNASSVDNMTWDGYLALISEAGTEAVNVTTVRLNPQDDPLVRGLCGPGRCNNPGLVDFIDVVVDREGRAWVALVDNCVEKCAGPEGKARDSRAARGIVGTLAEGPSLLDGSPLGPIRGATGL